MTLREQKRILAYLKMLEHLLDPNIENDSDPHLHQYFTDDELHQALLWHKPKKYTLENLEGMSRSKVISLLGDSQALLKWTRYSLEMKITAAPQYAQSEVHSFFTKNQKESHYLASKPVTVWDAYDRANYRSLLMKTGSTRRVFGIFLSNVKASDVYIVETKPEHLFDTQKEAEIELKRLIDERAFLPSELKIHSLWLLT